jgi:hypothetical protein
MFRPLKGHYQSVTTIGKSSVHECKNAYKNTALTYTQNKTIYDSTDVTCLHMTDYFGQGAKYSKNIQIHSLLLNV